MPYSDRSNGDSRDRTASAKYLEYVAYHQNPFCRLCGDPIPLKRVKEPARGWKYVEQWDDHLADKHPELGAQ